MQAATARRPAKSYNVQAWQARYLLLPSQIPSQTPNKPSLERWPAADTWAVRAFASVPATLKTDDGKTNNRQADEGDDLGLVTDAIIPLWPDDKRRRLNRY
ncbi:uncharacterized protein CLUP02_03914 [Colletotrichum lupini]|uniref:Uncharacterized protein n=1 Tax=Colletotrichum lupini TaxID=145971 RepID=A0A9Q8SL49_9PEZI|nr:uncharacterized protein CLUP02_03914 [Colletotrichum lupini]UQC78437.1 hypothetical protein CLUP02_03914 [Colletotrichum lupini]